MKTHSSGKRGVLERKLINLMKKDGILRGYATGETHARNGQLFGKSQVNSQQVVFQFLRKNPALAKEIEAKRKQLVSARKAGNQRAPMQVSAPKMRLINSPVIPKPQKETWVQLTPLAPTVQHKETLSPAMTQIVEMQEQLQRANSFQGTRAKREERLGRWMSRKRAASTMALTFEEDSKLFMIQNKVGNAEFKKLVKAYGKYFGGKKFPNASSVADKLGALEGGEKINLDYTKIFKFASWASYRAWKELKG